MPQVQMGWNGVGTGMGERSTEILTDSANSVRVGVAQMLIMKGVSVSVADFRLKNRLLGGITYTVHVESFDQSLYVDNVIPV
jgi:hypothetical protein